MDYSIASFIADAKKIFAGPEPLSERKALICERLQILSRQENLARFGIPLEPTDASNGGFILWNEPPNYVLYLVKFDRGYRSPVHEHGDFWICACGYSGHDRWDVYERLDDGSVPGFADLRLIDQVQLPPGRSTWMQAPPRAIHSHNNQAAEDTYELIFSAAMPAELTGRLLYDVENKTVCATSFDGRDHIGRTYTTPSAARIHRAGAATSLAAIIGDALCPVCSVMSRLRPSRFRPALLQRS